MRLSLTSGNCILFFRFLNLSCQRTLTCVLPFKDQWHITDSQTSSTADKSKGGHRGPEPTPQVLWALLTDERHYGRGEDAAALEHEGQAGAHEHGQVAAEPAKRAGEVCGARAGDPEPRFPAPTPAAARFPPHRR